jgi:hypothetical protein
MSNETPEIVNLAVRIIRFVDGHFPGFVECEFIDATNRRHTLIDKVPIVTTAPLNENSEYPQLGYIVCTAIRVW